MNTAEEPASIGDVHSVEFALAEDDVVAFASDPFLRTPLLRVSVGSYRILMFFGTITVAFAAYAIFGDGNWLYNSHFQESVVGYGFLAIVAVLFLERPLGIMRLRRHIRAGRYADFMKHRRVDVAPAGVILRSVGEEITVPWSNVARVVAIEAGALLVGVETTLAVPRRVFADQAAFASFVLRAQTLRRAALTGVGSDP